MATEKKTGSAVPNDRPVATDGADTRRLVKRMGVAGGMVLLLLGGLAVFDQYAGGDSADVAPPPQFTEPVPVPKKLTTQTLQADAGPVKSEEKTPTSSVPEATAPPLDKQTLQPPPQPEVAATPALTKGPAAGARSGVSKVAVDRTDVPGKDVAAPVHSDPRVNVASGKGDAGAEEVAAAEKPVQTSQESRAVAPQPLTPPRLLSGFALQAGVFSDPQRAQDLRDRILQAGIPVTIESRVEVGPFKSRSEAVAARAKLQALGVEAVMLPRKGTARR